MALPSSADCECGPLRRKGMRERGAAYAIRARRRDRAEHARGGEESVAAVDTKRWRGGKIGEGASRVSRDVRITQIVPATDRGGRGGHQSTDGGWQKRGVWCDCGGWTEGTFSGRISMCGVCVCVVCATERARHASAAGSGMATRCGEGRERATALSESWGERGKRGRPPEAF